MLKIKTASDQRILLEAGDTGGGKNLLTASSFCFTQKPRHANWTLVRANACSMSELTTNGIHYAANGGDIPISNSGGIAFYLDDLGLKPGDTITVSIDIKGTFGQGNQGMFFWHASSTSNNYFAVTKYSEKPYSLVIEDWIRASATYTIDDDFGFEKYREDRFFLNIFFDGGINSDVYVKNVKIERGSIATDWTPAPEDIEARLEALETALAQLQSGSE